MRSVSHGRVGLFASIVAVCTFAVIPALAGENITVTGVTGDLEPGGTLIISGYDFGAKDPALPRLWDDFEGNTVGQSIGAPVQGVYTQVGSAVYSATDPYTGDRCMHSFVHPGMGTPGLVSNWIPLEATDAFASMKFKLLSDSGSIGPHNIKLLRLNSHDPDPTHGYPNYNIGSERNQASCYGIVNHGLWGQVYTGGFSSLPNPQGWNSLAIWDHLGDLDVANGFVGRELNGSVEERHDIVTLQSGHMNGFRSAYFCAYYTHEGYDSNIYLDDVYADITLARVVVYDPDGGNHEMQIPTDWSSGEITVMSNAGRYPSGMLLKLVVYDADNNASEPYDVYVGINNSGGGGDEGPPGEPTDLTLELVDES